jgi:hypothetical protein
MDLAAVDAEGVAANHRQSSPSCWWRGVSAICEMRSRSLRLSADTWITMKDARMGSYFSVRCDW